MNILYRACASKNGYQSTLLNVLYRKGVFDRCTVVTQPLDDKDNYPSGIYHEINASIGYSCAYNKICEIEDYPEVPEELLLNLREYESTALNMTCRNHHMHIMYYDDMEHEYMRHVKYWNKTLEDDKIDFIFLATTPHFTWEYVIYSLGKVKGIPILVEAPSNVMGFNEVGTSIDNFGLNTKICYDTHRYNGMNEYILDYYNKVLNSADSERVNNKSRESKDHERWVKKLFYKPMFKRVFNTKNVNYMIREVGRNNKEYNTKLHYNAELLMRYFVKKKNYGNLKYYNNYVVSNMSYFENKYIFYALQYFPEASVLPRGGAFWNQLNAIKMLAHVACKMNMVVVVKEHWIEEGRSKRYYQELKSIKGVICVPSYEDSFRLIEKAVVVASETGTCLQESIIRGKPVITFANHYLCGAPGVFRVHSEDEIRNALSTIIQRDYCIDQDKVYHYFEAMSRTLVKGYLDWPEGPHMDLKECIRDTVDLIIAFVRGGMKSDFIYIKKDVN